MHVLLLSVFVSWIAVVAHSVVQASFGSSSAVSVPLSLPFVLHLTICGVTRRRPFCPITAIFTFALAFCYVALHCCRSAIGFLCSAGLLDAAAPAEWERTWAAGLRALKTVHKVKAARRMQSEAIEQRVTELATAAENLPFDIAVERVCACCCCLWSFLCFVLGVQFIRSGQGAEHFAARSNAADHNLHCTSVLTFASSCFSALFLRYAHSRCFLCSVR